MFKFKFIVELPALSQISQPYDGGYHSVSHLFDTVQRGSVNRITVVHCPVQN